MMILNSVSGKSLTLSALNLITISTSSGTVTIGGTGSSAKIAANGSDKSAYFNETTPGEDIPNIFVLSQNFPNPFNPTTTISFSLPSTSMVSLTIFDILGRKIATIVDNEIMAAGNYSKQWNALEFSSGIYFYRLQAGQFSEIKKLILLQ